MHARPKKYQALKENWGTQFKEFTSLPKPKQVSVLLAYVACENRFEVVNLLVYVY